MASQSPRLWPCPPGNSPRPLPTGPILFTMREIIDLKPHNMPVADSLNLDDLREYFSLFTLPDGKILGDLIDFSKRRPLLVMGELANPYRLCDIMAPDMPIIQVRMENICRTWADSLDSREVQPGIHHITMARLPGWWEMTHLTMVEPADLKRIVQWLDGPNPNNWLPKRIAEGTIRLEENYQLSPPDQEKLEWDGVTENVLQDIPPASGPSLDLSTIIVPIHTRMGCYNSRGRIVKCIHTPQTEFHDNLFRRGSSFKWSDILSFL